MLATFPDDAPASADPSDGDRSSRFTADSDIPLMCVSSLAASQNSVGVVLIPAQVRMPPKLRVKKLAAAFSLSRQRSYQFPSIHPSTVVYVLQTCLTG